MRTRSRAGPGPSGPNHRAEVSVAWLTASSDPEDYGSLISYRFPSGRNIEGPSQVFARMNQDEAFSQQRTLLGQTGSRILFGDFLVVPVEDPLASRRWMAGARARR